MKISEINERETYEKYRDVFSSSGFPVGRMISGSKSGYRRRNPENIVLFNARICSLTEGIIWWGDLDLTLDQDSLSDVAKKLGFNLFVMYEGNAWDNHGLTSSIIEKHSIAEIFTCENI